MSSCIVNPIMVPSGPAGPQGPPGTLECFSSTCGTLLCDSRPVYVLEPIQPEPAVADIDVVILTPGVGALMRTIPDGTVAGGECRGTGATDLQSFRNVPTQVASGAFSTLNGGQNNTASGNASVVAGGTNNIASGVRSTISGGDANVASADSATVGGGQTNIASGVQSAIAGGDRNTASGEESFIGGGQLNVASGLRAAISGGLGNTASGVESVVSGGDRNIASAGNSTVSGGSFNRSEAVHSSIGGGNDNLATGNFSHIGGGATNIASGIRSTISGGVTNTSSGDSSAIGGGVGNTASGLRSVVSGGGLNEVSGEYSIAAGGRENQVNADYSATLGGQELITSYPHSSAVGRWNLPGPYIYNNSPVEYIPEMPDPIPLPSERMFMVGGGFSDAQRRNLFSVTEDGNAHISGTVYTRGGGGSADFAELFETESGKRLPVGITVTLLPSGKIRPSAEGDVVIGVISNSAAFVGNSAEEWSDKYLYNADGSYQYEEVTIEEDIIETRDEMKIVEEEHIDYSEKVPKVTKVKVEKIIKVPKLIKAIIYDDKGEQIGVKAVPKVNKISKKVMQRKLNPLFDLTKPYVSRLSREEWNTVGLVGVVKILAGQPVDPRWINISKNGAYEMWLIR